MTEVSKGPERLNQRFNKGPHNKEWIIALGDLYGIIAPVGRHSGRVRSLDRKRM